MYTLDMRQLKLYHLQNFHAKFQDNQLPNAYIKPMHSVRQSKTSFLICGLHDPAAFSKYTLSTCRHLGRAEDVAIALQK